MCHSARNSNLFGLPVLGAFGLGVAIAFAVGCASTTNAPATPRAVGTPPSWRATTVASPSQAIAYEALAVAPLAADDYNAAVRPPPMTSAVHREVAARIAAAAARQGAARPTQDGRLDGALTTLANAMSPDGMLPNAAVDFALRRHGLVEPSPTLIVLWGPVDDLNGLGEQLDASLIGMIAPSAAVSFGVGVSSRGTASAIVVGVMPVELSLEPVPRSVPADQSIPLRGRLAAPLHRPGVVVTQPDGSIARMAGGPDRAFAVAVPCARQVGRHQVEITADGPHGATVVANFPVWCGTSPPVAFGRPATELPREPGYDTVEGAEAAMLALVNADRRAAGLAPLRSDARLVAIARAHSRDMKTTGLVAHRMPSTGDASDRVKRAGVAAATILENVARAVGVAEAHEALMNSPGHRANLMSPVATDVGIGMEFGDLMGGVREVFVTQVFIAVPAVISADEVVGGLERTLAEKRGLRSDAALKGVASGLAKELAAGRSTKEAKALFDTMMKPLSARFGAVGSAITATADLPGLDPLLLVKEAKGTLIGIGVAQGRHPDLGENTIWIVALYGTPR